MYLLNYNLTLNWIAFILSDSHTPRSDVSALEITMERYMQSLQVTCTFMRYSAIYCWCDHLRNQLTTSRIPTFVAYLSDEVCIYRLNIIYRSKHHNVSHQIFDLSSDRRVDGIPPFIK